MPFANKEFFKFVIVGGINTLHYYALYLVLLHMLNLHYFIAHTAAFVSSLIGSYFLNTLYTYGVKPSWKTFIRFPLTQLFNSGVTAVLLVVLVDLFHLSASLAPFAALIITVPVTFIITGRILKPNGKTKTEEPDTIN